MSAHPGSLPRQLIVGALCLVLGFATAELAVRRLEPTPRLQIVDPENPYIAIDVVEGVPLWYQQNMEDSWLRELDCDGGDAPRVLFAGDSIFYAIDHDREPDRITERVAEALGREVCVLDGSASGYLPYQQTHVVQQAHERHPIDVAVVIVWKQDRRFHRIGPVWVDSERVEHVDGTPLLPLPMPMPIHRALLERSAFWRFATFALANRASLDSAEGDAGAERAYEDLVTWADAHDVQLIFVEAVGLEDAFEESARARQESRPWASSTWQHRLQATAEAAGHQYVVVAEELSGKATVEEVRLDLCCHYNVRGHALLASQVAPRVRRALEHGR